MKGFLTLISKHVHESRWMLVLSAASLFALGWLFVFVTSRSELEILKMLASDDDSGRAQWMRNMGMADSPSSLSIMMAFWNHPLIILTLSIWAINRGSSAVAAEVERGTMDLVLSRPISRSAYLATQVLYAVVGLALLASALVVGAAVGVHYNALREPPSAWSLIKPALNLTALGLSIYGYTLLASAGDQVRWRPSSIGSVLTLGGYIAYVVSMIPVLQSQSWRPYLEKISIFKAYNPVELVTTGDSLARNVSILAGIGAGCIVLAFVVFSRRDLPTNA